MTNTRLGPKVAARAAEDHDFRVIDSEAGENLGGHLEEEEGILSSRNDPAIYLPCHTRQVTYSLPLVLSFQVYKMIRLD